jgi:DNA-binding CsgD family transcriptional regulator
MARRRFAEQYGDGFMGSVELWTVAEAALSPRELRALVILAGGGTVRDVAEELGVSRRWAGRIVASMRRKMRRELEA